MKLKCTNNYYCFNFYKSLKFFFVFTGAALVNFCEDCPKRTLLFYMDQMMVKLESILQARIADLMEGGGRRLVLEQMVTTIASVADTCEGNFVKFYDHLMPCLKQIIRSALAPELKLLRGKTIECVSLIGLAVGPDKVSMRNFQICSLSVV